MLYGFISLRYNKLIGMVLVLFSLTVGGSSSEQSNHLTILIIGDSLVQGFGLAQKDGLVNQLESNLMNKLQTVRTNYNGKKDVYLLQRTISYTFFYKRPKVSCS